MRHSNEETDWKRCGQEAVAHFHHFQGCVGSKEAQASHPEFLRLRSWNHLPRQETGWSQWVRIPNKSIVPWAVMADWGTGVVSQSQIWPYLHSECDHLLSFIVPYPLWPGRKASAFTRERPGSTLSLKDPRKGNGQSLHAYWKTYDWGSLKGHSPGVVEIFDTLSIHCLTFTML